MKKMPLRSEAKAGLAPLTGKLALVTGGARGLGLEISRQLAAQGAEVVVAARDGTKAEAAASALRGEGYAAHGLKLDVIREEDRKAAHDNLQKSHGFLDILINNAAVYLDSENAATPAPRLASGTPEDLLRTTFEINFFAPVFLTQALLPLLRQSKAGRIVNLSSIRGSLTLQTDPASTAYPKAFAYDASKTALNAFTVQLAEELRQTAIKVNAIHPGWVRTKMGSEAADLSLEEGARTAILYASLPDDGPTGGFFYLDERLPW
ncbi:MAG: short-chain dehydrogenase [Rhizobium sp.]|nr:short-chain dehydrogenase [Rhizobium sp.]